MAQIDALIGSMVQSHVKRVLIVNDKPMHFYMENGEEKAGSAIPGAQLQQVVAEITPADMKNHLSQDGGFNFPYQSPHGPFEIGVGRANGSLQVTITTFDPTKSANDVAAIGGHAPTTAETVESTPAPPASAPIATSPATPAAPGGGKRPAHIDELFHLMNDMEASDLHLSSEEYPMVRQHGIMKQLKQYEILQPDFLKKLLWDIAPERNREEWESDRDTDFAYEVPDLARFRCNYFEDRKGIGAVFRLIPSEVLTAEQLNLKAIHSRFVLFVERFGCCHRPDRFGKIYHARGDD